MPYEPDAGDIVWVDLDPRVGREQGGRRPVVVVTDNAFWQTTGMVVLCPITSKIRPFPSSVVLPDGLPIKGEILTGQIRCVDTTVRPFKFSGVHVPPETLDEIRAKLGVLLGIL
ncbi:MAG TPA: type II toxin-antitoxin system PemK/MazF family toxin [Alphaproteobacteria bacterium]|nr:type II toxin-antitoxin system PemK/MazF family toxin [Alphaproteobacteria bacterium]